MGSLRGEKNKRGKIDQKIISSKISVEVITMASIEDQNSKMARDTINNIIKVNCMIILKAKLISNINYRINDSTITKTGIILKATIMLSISVQHADVVSLASNIKKMLITVNLLVIDGTKTGRRLEISTANSKGKKKRSKNASLETRESITRCETNLSTMLASVASSLKSSVSERKSILLLTRKIVSLILGYKSTQADKTFLAAVEAANKLGNKKANVIKKIT